MTLGNLAQSAKRLIDSFGGPKESRNVGIEDHDIGSLLVAVDILAAHRSAEVIFRKHFRTPLAVSLLFHSSFAPIEWHDGR